jgi:hypothetical protein
MSSGVRRLTRALAGAALLLVLSPASARAQLPHPLDEAPHTTDFLPRFDWKASIALLGHPDPRFTWDAQWVGDFDLVTYPNGRASVLAAYQTLLGSEFRPFDPYQSNYQLEASGSAFAGRTEVAAVLSHVSRHLGDRPNRTTIAENSFGARLLRRFGAGAPASLDVRLDARKVVARSYDDYTWIEEVEMVARRRFNPHVSAFLRGYGQLIQVDPDVLGRPTQRGGRLEAGLNLRGRQTQGPAAEVFVGGEQMIDADPLDRTTRRWAYVGVRLLGR